ncbi:hypothetical protein E6H33_09010 [Candidatus Bathyarchaeota archaeon]|nr:MAG: hypothetical protein E6H33_09010 [Candidatus Bathyarchaeota archaeon]
MRPLARELLATDGVLGFYNAGGNNPHKYPRIQIKLKASLVIEQLATFLQADLSISASCRSTLSVHEGRSRVFNGFCRSTVLRILKLGGEKSGFRTRRIFHV